MKSRFSLKYGIFRAGSTHIGNLCGLFLHLHKISSFISSFSCETQQIESEMEGTYNLFHGLAFCLSYFF